MISLDYSDSLFDVKAGFHCCSLSWWSLFYFLAFYRTVIVFILDLMLIIFSVY